MIHVENLHKHYETVHAVKGIHFSVRANAFFALLGPNGAGKSTTIEIISTLLQKDSGKVKVANETLGENDDAIRRALGVVFQYSTLDATLTLRENLRIRGAFYGLTGKALDARIDELDQVIGFKPYLDQPLKTCSGGQKRKADIARALLHNPKLLILDEPTTGLDPKSRKDIWNLILTLKSQHDMTLFLTTHYMEEVLDADHVIIMHEGEIVAEDSAENLRRRYADDMLKIVPKKGLEDALKAEGIAFERINDLVRVPLNDAFQGLDVVNRHKALIETFEIIKANMDDVFLNITGERLGSGDDHV